jgi:hypothetical protein
MFKLLGFSIFSARLVSLFFGIINIFVLNIILKNIDRYIFNQKRDGTLIHPLAFIYFFEPLYISSMHNGRMETTALFFILLAVHFIFKNYNQYNLKTTLLSAVFFSLAFLTTPRVFFTFSVIAALLFPFNSTNTKNFFLHVSIYGLIVTLFFLSWIIGVGVDSYIKNLELLKQSGDTFTLFNRYVNPYHFPFYFVLFLCLIYFVITSFLQNIKLYNLISFRFFIIFIIPLFVFFLIIKDNGIYSTLVFVFAHISLYSLLYNPVFEKFFSYVFITLGCYYLVLFITKFTIIFLSFNQRNPKPIEKFVASHIPVHSKVIGDEMFYYAVEKNNSAFQFIHLFYNDSIREHLHRKSYNYDYIIWSEKLQKERPELLNLYQAHSTLIPIDSFQVKEKIKLDFLPFKILSNYNCTIYKRIKN